MNKNKDQVVNFWDNVAKRSSHKNRKNAGMLGPGTAFFEADRQSQENTKFNQLIDLNTISNVLEVGCGGGRWCFYLSDKVSGSITGIDISGEMIKLANSLLEREKLKNIEFYQKDFLSLDDIKKYDLIYFSGVLQYIEDDKIMEMLKKIKNEASSKCIILCRDTIQLKERITKTGDYPVIYRTKQEYIDLFSKSGFDLIASEIAYKIPRFSRIINLFYHPPFMGLNFARFIGKILNIINNILGNPRFLMSKGLYKAIQSGNMQNHIFTVYERSSNEKE